MIWDINSTASVEVDRTSRHSFSESPCLKPFAELGMSKLSKIMSKLISAWLIQIESKLVINIDSFSPCLLQILCNVIICSGSTLKYKEQNYFPGVNKPHFVKGIEYGTVYKKHSKLHKKYVHKKEYGSFHEIVNLKNSRNEIVFDRLWYPCPSYCSPP